jgi:hypothetical protein
VITGPQLTMIILQDEVVILAGLIMRIEMNNSDCFAIMQSNKEIVANLLVFRYRIWIERQFNNARS